MKKTFLILLSVLAISCGGNQEEPNKPPTPPNPSEKADIKVTEKDGFKIVSVTDLRTRDVYVKDNKYVYQKIDEDDKEVYVKFNLEKATQVTGDDWDIAFCNRSIIVNGGQTVTDAPYSSAQPARTAEGAIAIMGKDENELKPENLVITAKETDGNYLTTTKVPTTAVFRQDTEKMGFAIDGQSKGMSEYFASPVEHIVTVKKNRFLIIKTHKGHYAKLKILSLYDGAGATALQSLETGDMNAGMKYFGFYTFIYSYNTKKGDKKLQ